jgi:hypothetical protein
MVWLAPALVSGPTFGARYRQSLLVHCVRASIASYEAAGLILKRRWRRGFTVSYGEIFTAERLASMRGLRPHTRTSDPIRIAYLAIHPRPYQVHKRAAQKAEMRAKRQGRTGLRPRLRLPGCLRPACCGRERSSRRVG